MALKLEIAQEMLLAAVAVMPVERQPLAHCWQRVLAETVIADIDFPPFDRSPLDGYAVIATEVEQARPDAPVRLRQIENIAAGSVARESVRPGTACRIMTGAPIPPGATGVIRLEDTAVDGDIVSIMAGAGAAKNICRRGEEIATGEVILTAGTVINAGAMGMLAVLGKAEPLVYVRPRVALIATGSELIAVDEPLVPGKIRNSNSYMLSAQVQEAGAQARLLGVAGDDVDAIAELVEYAADCDVCITTGGASVGDYDLIGEVFKKLGVKVLFERVSIKPGMPVLAGVKENKLFIGLSGNPAAASISFEQLVRPVLLKMSGRTNWWRPCVKARLAAPFGKSTGAKRFVWARCWQGEAGLLAEPLSLQGNGMLKSAIAANALVVIPENSPPLPAGTEVEVILLVNG
ncbi:molybdenum cofactor synthesis domain [Thermosinus carboxydivorans Nor1]|uniref:Molybdopterin molybdenumtransferase n=1 Tax=Thermosinus carboxydivorans Nor1 TaxID=401526 RepID=A1HUC7_9FIRM|nr:gephyrin-like molybdotransferase Glp [Thermosinus carboxydivorans]EAX46365.1 molybdenum cofactor synthesis domain [Thermosinus carboxydivorans Nor1]